MSADRSLHSLSAREKRREQVKEERHEAKVKVTIPKESNEKKLERALESAGQGGTFPCNVPWSCSPLLFPPHLPRSYTTNRRGEKKREEQRETRVENEKGDGYAW